jgi:2-oxoglutarate ferredoxin oxidoreductase subunit delta
MSKKDYKTYRQENKEMIYDNHLALCKGCGLCIEFCPAKCITWHQTNRGHFGARRLRLIWQNALSVAPANGFVRTERLRFR